MSNKYSLHVLNNLKDESKLKLCDGYETYDKYISTTKIRMKCTYDSCFENTEIRFDALLRSKRAYCKTHRYHCVGEKTKNTLSNKNKLIYDENRKTLYNLFKELNTELVGDYSDIDIKNDTTICYICGHNECNVTGIKQFHTLVKNTSLFIT